MLLINIAAAASAPESFRGMPLAQALSILQQRGLQIIYSTDLVKPWMQIRAEPVSTEPERMLAEILAPFALQARRASNEVYAVVRAERPRVSLVAPPAVNESAAALLDGTPLAEIVVAASQYELTRGISGFPHSLTSTDIESLPDLGDDALRAVARLPGTASNGLTARANVRGGEAGETLVRFDGVRLYNPFHLKDFQSIFSAVDPRIVSSVDVYMGGFPAMYGDRMSGVIDITSLDAPAPRYGEVNLSFFNTSTLYAGQFAANRGEWVASIRRSNLDVWYHAFSKLPGTPSYLDGFGKLSYQMNDEVRLTAGTLYFNDEISLTVDDGDEQASADYTDQYYWIRLDHQPTDALNGTTVLTHAQLDSTRMGVTDKEGVSHGSLNDQRSFDIDSLQTDWSWHGTERWLVQFGGEIRHTRGHYDYHDDAVFDVLVEAPGTPTADTRANNISVGSNASPYALYGSLRYGITPSLTSDVGLRFESNRLEPRLGIRYEASERTVLRASWGRIYQSQGIDELQITDGIGNAFAPQRADQTSLGFEHRLPRSVELRVEVYDKRLTNLRPRYENLLDSLTLVPELKPDRIALAPRSGRARGVELLLSNGDSTPLRWWVSYSWSSAKEQIGGADVARGWDQPHALSAGVDWTTSRWKVSAALLQRTGWPATTVSLDDELPVPRLHTGVRNAARMGFFRSLDVRLERRFEFDRSSLTSFLEITNLLGRRNPCCTAYEIDDEGGGLELQRRNYLPRVPSLGFIWQF